MKHILLLSIFAFSATFVAAAPGDADDADSLNFESFHEEKEGAIVIWDADKGELGGFTEKHTTVTYEKAPAEPAATTPAASGNAAPAVITEDLSPNAARAQAIAEAQAHERRAQGKGYDGQRFMIRARYSLGNNSKTGDSVASAIHNLHQQMAQHCPQGWLNIKEWSLPVEQDYYLHYLFQCASASTTE
ncbi:MAG: hypothetical protein EP312_05050 [Gammaproteobacteria bacterium]|nr:MAG: hypothetical protein EP312_05050 [Gammaproteobacteria bacterium]